MSDRTQEEAHTGPIKTPKQMLWAAVFSLVVPIFLIFCLVAQQIESNVMVPRVMAHPVGISPLTVLLGILIGRSLYGCSAPLKSSHLLLLLFAKLGGTVVGEGLVGSLGVVPGDPLLDEGVRLRK